MNLKGLLSSLALFAFIGAGAHTTFLSEDFNGASYAESFPLMIEGDHLSPISNLQGIFMDGNGVFQPWRKAKDAATSPDGFLVSHSCYTKPGTSRDFLVSAPLQIPTAGFILEFDAQSIRLRSDASKNLSDLHLFLLPAQPTEQNLPEAAEAYKVFTAIPLGQDPDNCEGDWTHYTVPLDNYAGKTVYLAFANLNTDKDILAIDNVKVLRYDEAEITASAPRYVDGNDFTLSVSVKNTSEQTLPAFTLNIEGGSQPITEQGEALAPGQSKDFSFTLPIQAGSPVTWKVSATFPGLNTIEAEGISEALAFSPVRRVLLEETTGTWCGNCPMGIYTIEKLLADPDIKGQVVPVAIHIHDMAMSEPMVCPEYFKAFGIESAPMYVVNRNGSLMGFNINVDKEYNPEDVRTAAGFIKSKTQEPALADVTITDAQYSDDGTVSVHYTVRPAVNLDGSRLAIGLVLTEDNVGFDMIGVPSKDIAHLTNWWQHNYCSGVSASDKMNGWADLGSTVRGVRYQHVARALNGFNGIPGSLPAATLKAGDDYSYIQTIKVPDTLVERDGKVCAPAVRREHLNAVAYLIDTKTQEVLNCDQLPLEEHEHHDTLALMADIASVPAVEPADAAPAEYFTVEGLQVATPRAGQIYIVRQGERTSKVIY